MLLLTVVGLPIAFKIIKVNKIRLYQFHESNDVFIANELPHKGSNSMDFDRYSGDRRNKIFHSSNRRIAITGQFNEHQIFVS